MAYKLIISETAERELENILHYIAVKLENRQAALDFVQELENIYQNVINNPYMYEESRLPRLKQSGYRRIPVKNYIILYKVNTEKKEVFITHIIYGKRNYAEFV